MVAKRKGPLGVLSATGAMLYRAANGDVTAVVPGNNGDVLTLAAGIPAWSAPVAGGTKRMFFEAETNANNASHRVRNIGASGNFNFNFEVPLDFTALSTLEMWGASRTATNPAAPITITSNFGGVGQTPTNHSSALGITPAFTAGLVFGYSIASVFGVLAAGDRCAVNISHGGIGGSIDYYGVYLEYT